MFQNVAGRVGSGHDAQKSHGSGRVKKFGISRVLSGRVGSGRVGSGRVGSGRVGSGRVGSVRVEPGRFLNITGGAGSPWPGPTREM